MTSGAPPFPPLTSAVATALQRASRIAAASRPAALGISYTDTVLSRAVLEAFDAFLAARDLSFEAVVIGGTALNLLGVTTRVTRDCDLLDPLLPEPIAEAARSFAREWRAAGADLGDDWLNNGPASLTRQLPFGWHSQTSVVFQGAALVLRVPGRADLLRTKLFALCDRGLDLPDCIALAPDAAELAALLPWVAAQDANPGWPTHVRATLDDLARRLGHAI